MGSRLWINIGLLLFIVAVVVIMQLDEQSAEENSAIVLSDMDAQTIDTITILRHGEQKMAFAKQQDQGWFLQSPYLAPAHPTRIASILGLLATPSTHQLSVSSIDRSELGLEAPETSLILNDLQLDFGTTHPLDNSRYVLVDDTVHTISDHVFHQLNTNPSFFINPKVLILDEGIQSITTPLYRIEQTDEGWLLSPEINSEIAQATTLKSAWLQMEAQAALPHEGELGEQEVVVSYGDGEHVRFSIIQQQPLTLVNLATNIQYQISETMGAIVFPPQLSNP